jgi:hypothetical protein
MGVIWKCRSLYAFSVQLQILNCTVSILAFLGELEEPAYADPSVVKAANKRPSQWSVPEPCWGLGYKSVSLSCSRARVGKAYLGLGKHGR